MADRPGGVGTAGGGAAALVQSAATVTALGVATQVLALGTQVVIARAFGATTAMDAFVVASTLPQYLIAVLLGALVIVFVPVFVEYHASPDPMEGWRVASAVVTLSALLLVAVSAAGALFAPQLIRWTTDGLGPEAEQLATRVARVTWPTVAASGIAGLVTGIHHACGRFAWPALVPLLGAALNLVLAIALARPFGVTGVAVAGVAGVMLQALLLLRGMGTPSPLRLSFDWRHPGVRRAAALMWPLVVSGLVIRYTPVIDRYLASGLPDGSIAHLSYALRLTSFLSVFLATGIATVVFPRMAHDTAAGDLAGLRRTLSQGLRVMWLGVAPVIAIGAVAAGPAIALLFERGAFLPADTTAVSFLLTLYLLSLASTCLGNVTGRAFYALKQTRLLAVAGVIEACAYPVYTWQLTRWLGAPGVALGFVAYNTISLSWQLPLLRAKLGGTGGGDLASSFLRTAAAALAAGAAAAAAMQPFDGPFVRCVAASVAGAAAYGITMSLWGGREWTTGLTLAAAAVRRPWVAQPLPAEPLVIPEPPPPDAVR